MRRAVNVTATAHLTQDYHKKGVFMSSVQSRHTHKFSEVPSAEIQRSSFNRSHGHKTTFNAGLLVPVFIDEVLPGDTFNLKMTAFARLATPLFPIMDNIYLESFFFFVPNRLVWSNWEKFNGEQVNPADSTSFLVPTMPTPGAGVGVSTGEVGDYFGIPIKVSSLNINSLPFRAYNLIWNSFFRDENLQNSLTVDLGNGPDTYTNYSTVRKRGKRHDYFTSCLPWPQKINDGTVVTIPLGTTAPVVSTGANPTFTNASLTNTTFFGTNANTQVNVSAGASAAASAFRFGTTTGLQTDLSTATAATINQLRQAFQLQRLYDRDARGGSRYTEIIRAHFGVISPDARLQRPEYLGGGRAIVNINPVAQTSATSGSNALGDLAAFGTAHLHGHGFTKSFTEHGFIIGLVSTRSDMNYQQGLDRMWSRQIRWDFYWPALSHIGEQAVLNREIYAQGTAADTNVFGYQERYAEYRYKPSVITGLFRSTATGTLDAWHLAQNFGSLPTLNSTFIEETLPMNRIKAVSTDPDFIMDTFFELKTARPMPIFGVPGLIDHF